MNINYINNEFNLNYDSQTISFKANELPEDFNISQNLFREMKIPINIVDQYAKTPCLKGKVVTLESTIKKLAEASKSDTKNKVFAVIKAALYVAVVTAGVFAAKATGGGGPLVGVSTATLIVSYCLNIWYLAGANVQLNEGTLILGMLIAPFIPLFDAFGKVSGLNKEIQKQKNEVEEKFAETVKFFAHQDHSVVLAGLTEKIKETEKCIADLDALPAPSRLHTKAARAQLETQKAHYTNIKQNLDNAISYYGHFKK